MNQPWHLTVQDAVRATRLTEEQYRPRSLHGMGYAADYPIRGDSFRTFSQKVEAARLLRKSKLFSYVYGRGPMADAVNEGLKKEAADRLRADIAAGRLKPVPWERIGKVVHYLNIGGYFSLYSSFTNTTIDEESEELLADAARFIRRYGLPLSAQDLTLLN